MSDLLRPVVNVKDYGAHGDGLVDDTAAVSRAMAEVVRVGGIAFFPAGRYYFGRVERHKDGR